MTGAASGEKNIHQKSEHSLMDAGIGRATACAFALHGCQNLFLGDLNIEGLEETKKIILAENEVQVHISRLDIADEAMVASFHDKCVKIFGKIDYVANVAGYAHPASECHALAEKQFDLSYNVNMKGVSNLIFLGLMQSPFDALDS